MDSPPATGAESAHSEGDIPSCQGCRRRKLRCSREKPTCAHCLRLESPCVYDAKKSKPGVKAGAIESLNRRVEALENVALENSRQGSSRDQPPAAPTDTQQIIGAFSSLIQELRGLVSSARAPPSQQGSSVSPRNLGPVAATPAPYTSPPENGYTFRDPTHVQSHPRKKRRVDSCGNPNIELTGQLEELANDSTNLPPPAFLEEIIDAYFNIIQPWIPILHETYFRRRIDNDEERPELVVLLHAIVVAAARFVDSPGRGITGQEVELWTSRSRRIVKTSAMEALSVENLQALIIIAFNDMGNGDMSKAWPVIGSLTRTVEYLQLSVETDDRQEKPLLRPLLSIPPAHNWTQEEERRRVFWTIFALDSWNTSLTSDDVRRRLPADGGLWHKEDPVTTPYFGIWDRSAAKIGNSIAFLPAHYPSPDQITDAPPETPTTAMSAPSGISTVDMSTVGAFAYCIEATESLSRVTTYFLQQRINFQDRQEVGNWLTRFKELDLRLVHWKMFLPRKWKDSNISRRETLTIMDPNLTLAHVTHNTSMILLHQQIAYPPPQWTGIVRMPSAHSADTCLVAASETATIAEKYLRYTPERGPNSSQFAFCVFISARALLVHRKYCNTDLAPEFWLLVDCLDEMARRWVGLTSTVEDRPSLAAKYSSILRELHNRCETDPDFSLDVLGYSTDGFSNQTADSLAKGRGAIQDYRQADTIVAQTSFDTATASNAHRFDSTAANGARTFVPVGGGGPTFQTSPTSQVPEHHSNDELTAISTALMDQDYAQMDRVISFDDMLFTVQTGNEDTAAMAGGNWTFG
ncbi:related to C6 transcription factor [Cephalotrichum gorgonifer]|uniref:Related to C6 transcription factor n=1 Tax=Cephalotrichum gorgonifer TaxID=2041049 RepID=A0AAE8MS65_9PEZI|nr:related to C6 transcription factor [Cephalotrichum gorgonifer]